MTTPRFDGAWPLTQRTWLPPQYDVSPDGRFVVLRRTSEGSEIAVVLNWIPELRAKLSATKR